MGEFAAFMRREALNAISYRANMALSLVGLLLSVVPVFFIARALDPVMARSIAGEASHYFSFVLVGTIALRFASVGTQTLPATIGSGIRTGTLEALLGTPVGLPSLLIGMSAYSVFWALVQSAALLLVGLLFGARYSPANLLLGVGIVALITLAYSAIGLCGAALVLRVRTMGPLPSLVIGSSVLLGGVYYPTHVIPSWIQSISAVIPLTYGVRALRRALLEGAPVTVIGPDLLALASITAVLLFASVLLFGASLRYARWAGTLSQY